MSDDATALLMLSGGPDSAVLASVAWRERSGATRPNAVYLRTGHPAEHREIPAAQQIAGQAGGRLEIVDVPELLRAMHNDRLLADPHHSLVPLGNAVALSIMLLCAVKKNAAAIYAGYHRDDAEQGYAQPAIDRLEKLAAVGRETAPKFITPFLGMTKAEVLKLGASLGVTYAQTWSCAQAGDLHCGRCPSCQARRRAIAEAGLADPVRYQE
jgi:7-cyano-7-deazaguanine synthase